MEVGWQYNAELLSWQTCGIVLNKYPQFSVLSLNHECIRTMIMSCSNSVLTCKVASRLNTIGGQRILVILMEYWLKCMEYWLKCVEYWLKCSKNLALSLLHLAQKSSKLVYIFDKLLKSIMWKHNEQQKPSVMTITYGKMRVRMYEV